MKRDMVHRDMVERDMALRDMMKRLSEAFYWMTKRSRGAFLEM